MGAVVAILATIGGITIVCGAIWGIFAIEGFFADMKSEISYIRAFLADWKLEQRKL